jgi:hypothetical protein
MPHLTRRERPHGPPQSRRERRWSARSADVQTLVRRRGQAKTRKSAEAQDLPMRLPGEAQAETPGISQICEGSWAVSRRTTESSCWLSLRNRRQRSADRDLSSLEPAPSSGCHCWLDALYKAARLRGRLCGSVPSAGSMFANDTVGRVLS